MYKTFEEQIQDLLQEKDISSNFNITVEKINEKRKVRLHINKDEQNRLIKYISSIYIPSELKKADIVLNKNNQLLQQVHIDYLFTQSGTIQLYSYPKLLTVVPDLYDPIIPFNMLKPILLEIRITVNLEVEQNYRNWFFQKKTKIIKLPKTHLILFKKRI